MAKTPLLDPDLFESKTFRLDMTQQIALGGVMIALRRIGQQRKYGPAATIPGDGPGSIEMTVVDGFSRPPE